MALIPSTLRRGGDTTAQDFLDKAATIDPDRSAKYALYDRYYNGDQKTQLTDRARLYLEASGLKFCENFCEPIVDALAERLAVTAFTTGAAPLDEQIGEWWERNRMDAVQGVVHTQTVMKGDGYVVADWNSATGRPRFTWNPPERVKVVYSDDQPDEVLYASKVWFSRTVGPSNPQGERVERLNVYYPDRVEKFFRLQKGGKGGWARWSDEGDGVWPVVWTTQAGEPFGVPVFHFRHKPLGDQYGRSRLHGVIPFQDELNKTVLDLNAVLDSQGWPQRWVTGVTKDNADFKHVPGNVLMADSKDAKFGQFKAADPAGLLKAIEDCLWRMARRSRTPLHLLTGGDMPSGESLKAAESGLVQIARDAQTTFGCAWEELVGFGVRLAADQGVASDVPADLVVNVQWRDPESRNEKEHLESALLKKELGVSDETLLSELGYDPVDEAEKRSREASVAQERLAMFMNRGSDE